MALTAVLAVAIFLTAKTAGGELEYVLRVLESPPPPEPLEKPAAAWLLIAALAIFAAMTAKLIAELIDA
jgi:hypothetical protein